MATVQHLEKLRHLQRLFSVEDSLEAAVACERLAILSQRTEQLIKQRAFLREERRRLRIGAERIAERDAALHVMQRNDWIPATLLLPTERHIRLNIGGLMFESTESILRRDSKSLLAQLCNPDPPVLADPEGFFYFDRDWWLFRYIMVFLRDGILPNDRNLLAQLYRESGFWHLEELQHAIEEQKLHLRQTPEEKDKLRSWWRKSPTWLQAVDEAVRKEEEEHKVQVKKEDWWNDTQYKGKVYLPMSTVPDKIVTKKGEKDVKEVPSSTWKYSNDSDNENDRYQQHYTGIGYDHHKYDNNSRYPSVSSPTRRSNDDGYLYKSNDYSNKNRSSSDGINISQSNYKEPLKPFIGSSYLSDSYNDKDDEDFSLSFKR